MATSAQFLYFSFVAVVLQAASGAIFANDPEHLPTCPENDAHCDFSRATYIECWQRNDFTKQHFPLITRCLTPKDLSESIVGFMRCLGEKEQHVLNPDCTVAANATETSIYGFEANCETLAAMDAGGQPQAEGLLRPCREPMKEGVKEAMKKCIAKGPPAWERAPEPFKCRNQLFAIQCCMVSEIVALYQNSV